jgi:uncharacterized protein
MSYLIDGHNLIPKIPGFSLKSLDDEQELIAVLQEYCRIRRKTVEVYFDRAPAGMAGTRAYGTVKAHFVRKGVTADNAIIARVRQLGRTATNWVVVSSDRRVQIEVKSLGAQVVSSEEFSQEVILAQEERRAETRVEGTGLGEDEIEDWLRLFGDGDPKRKPKNS